MTAAAPCSRRWSMTVRRRTNSRRWCRSCYSVLCWQQRAWIRARLCRPLDDDQREAVLEVRLCRPLGDDQREAASQVPSTECKALQLERWSGRPRLHAVASWELMGASGCERSLRIRTGFGPSRLTARTHDEVCGEGRENVSRTSKERLARLVAGELLGARPQGQGAPKKDAYTA